MQREVSYEEAMERKYPEQVVIGIVRDGKGRYNPVTIGWVMPASKEPAMLVIALGHERYSLELVRQAGEFVVALPSEAQGEEALLFGTRSGRELDKFAATGTKLEKAKKIDAMLMSEAVANFECKVVGEMVTGDHVLIVGEVVCSHVNEAEAGRLYSWGEKLGMGGAMKK